MSKTKKITTFDIKTAVMQKVKNDEIRMKPRWMFVIGSLLSIVGIISSSMIATIMLSIVFFTIRSRGLMGQWKIQQLIELFPWWVFILAISSMAIGIVLLKKYDFSYKKNFIWIIIALVFSFIVSAYALDVLGITSVLTQQGPMNRLYHQQGISNPTQRGTGVGNQENGKHLYRQR